MLWGEKAGAAQVKKIWAVFTSNIEKLVKKCTLLKLEILYFKSHNFSKKKSAFVKKKFRSALVAPFCKFMAIVRIKKLSFKYNHYKSKKMFYVFTSHSIYGLSSATIIFLHYFV